MKTVLQACAFSCLMSIYLHFLLSFDCFLMVFTRLRKHNWQKSWRVPGTW